MFDLRAIRDNPEAFIAAWNRKKSGLGDETVSELLELDENLRAAVAQKQEAETIRNAKSKLIGKAMAAGDHEEAESLKVAVSVAKANLEVRAKNEVELRERLNAILMGTPNLPLAEVPEGADEDANVEKARWGEPKAYDFEAKDHADLGEALGMMDFETAAKMSGARFVLLSGKLARLERALAAFMLDTQTEQNGYEECSPPLLVRDNALKGTGQLPKFKADLFDSEAEVMSIRADALESITNIGEQVRSKLVKLKDRSEQDKYDHLIREGLQPSWRLEQDTLNYHLRVARSLNLIPTAEVPLTNIVADSIIEDSYLPRRYTAHTPCFRSEAGSAGRDTKGMIRLHQFNKVELVSIVRNEEEGLAELERMTRCAEGILEALELPYRRMLLCTGDMGFGARKTYDLEVWLPSQDTYREISSCSYCGDFQARRMKARWRPAATEETPKPKPQFVHTLNGSGLAVGRTLVAVLENYQNEDGSITVPKVLQTYMGGLEVIK